MNKIPLISIKNGDILSLVKYYDNAIQQVARTKTVVSDINGCLCFFNTKHRPLTQKEYEYWDEIRYE